MPKSGYETASKLQDWPWSSFRHYATGVAGTVEIESQRTVFGRGNQLPANLRYAERDGGGSGSHTLRAMKLREGWAGGPYLDFDMWETMNPNHRISNH